MFTCGPTFFVGSGGSGPLPPGPTTHTMDYVFAGQVFVVMAIASIPTVTMDQIYQAQPFYTQ